MPPPPSPPAPRHATLAHPAAPRHCRRKGAGAFGRQAQAPNKMAPRSLNPRRSRIHVSGLAQSKKARGASPPVFALEHGTAFRVLESLGGLNGERLRTPRCVSPANPPTWVVESLFETDVPCCANRWSIRSSSGFVASQGRSWSRRVSGLDRFIETISYQSTLEQLQRNTE